MIRQLKDAHDTAAKDRSAAMITLKAMIVQAPEQLRTETAKKTQRMLARHCAALRPRALETPDDSIRHTLRSIAKKWEAGHEFPNRQEASGQTIPTLPVTPESANA
ncbi:hypothetical protein [Glaciihabitans sp. UYNi722]|uniref:hypothetical protein n=1 Tax=Glaciihabitans sp. UYNi722 TaxID=3156344 RepID=UPI003393B5D9